MQALILAWDGRAAAAAGLDGAEPVVPLVDRPVIALMMEWLHGHGVDDVVIGCGFLADEVHNVLGDGSAYGVRLRYVGSRPLGTGGALKFAEPLLDERFLMLNGDVLTDIDVSRAGRASTSASGAPATLALHAGGESGRLRARAARRADGEVSAFVEKPAPDQIDTRNIKASTYVFHPSCSGPAAGRAAASIERESSRRWSGNGLCGYVGDGYWRDIGTPALPGGARTTSSRARCATNVTERSATPACAWRPASSRRAESSRRRSSRAAAAIGEGARRRPRGARARRRRSG